MLNSIELKIQRSNLLITQNSCQYLNHQDNANTNAAAGTGREVLMAKISLAIVFVFIFTHSIKWIPNIQESLMVRYT